MSRQTRVVLIIFGSVLAALLVVLGVVLMLLGGGDDGNTSEPPTSLPDYVTTTTTTKPPVKYAIPNLVGKNFYEVRNEKTNGEFIIVNERQEHNEKPAGTILSQEPEAGVSVDKGATITVVISSGPDDKIQLIDLSGWTKEHAEQYLTALGLKVQIDETFISEQPYGYVESTAPAANSEVKKGDTVTLRVSCVEESPDSSDTQEDPNFSDALYPEDDPQSEGDTLE